MTKSTTVFKRALFLIVAVVQLIGVSTISYSQVALASESPASGDGSGNSQVTCPKVSGNKKPTGSAAHTYTYSPSTCTWENAYYSWNPVTKVYTPKYDKTPVLNADGTAWEHQEWRYSAASGKYVLRTVSIPVPQPIVPDGEPSDGSTGTSSGYAPSVPGYSGNTAQTLGGNTIDGTGAQSNNAINNQNNTDANLDISNNTNVFTTHNSNSTSGDAYVLQNTNGGSASTGDAEVIANYLNMIQSGWSPQSGISTFNSSLYGNLHGDLLFDPSSIMNTGYDSDNEINNENDTDLVINAEDNASIHNDINLDAKSGDAKVAMNTHAGDASTGDATAVANLMNFINSSIDTNGSFIGNLNIYGNLDGDILLPYSVLSMLSNTGPYSNNQIANNNNVDLDGDINKNSSITNNIDLTAASGNAKVAANTNAGNATSGNATTNAEQVNLIGQNVSGDKGLLVFVNVLGNWMGLVFGGDSSVGTTGPYSNNTINNSNDLDADINYDQNYDIVNNINVNSQSGDATVTKNTNAGSASTGDASSAVNIVNLIDSNFDFSDWFGVLFINVFGSWNGAFGADTVAGDDPRSGVKSNSYSTSSSPNSSSSQSGTTDPYTSNTANRFVSAINAIGDTASSPSANSSNSSKDNDGNSNEVAFASSDKSVVAAAQSANWFVPAVALILAGLIIGRKQLQSAAQSVFIKRK